MRKKIFFIALILLSFQFELYAQNRKDVEITVRDSETLESLANVHVKTIGFNSFTITSQNGKVSFALNSLPLQLEFTHVAYKKKTVWVEEAMNMDVFMEKESLKLPEFTFSAIRQVVNDGNIYILDFEFYRKNLVILGYYERYNRSSIFMIDVFGDTLSETKLAGKASYLQKDCDREIQLVQDDQVFSMEYVNNEFKLKYLYTNKTEGIRLACLCYYNKGYLSGFYVTNQLYTYVSIDADSTLNYFRILDNRDYLNQAANWGVSVQNDKEYDFNYLNNLAGRNLSYKKHMTVIEEAGMYKDEDDFYAGLNMNPNVDNRYLLNLHYYNHVINKAVYVPIFKLNGYLYLFNHVDGQIEKYTSNLELVSQVKIDYFEHRNWKREILLDEITHKVYGLFEKSGSSYLKEIDLKTGKLISEKKLPFSFVSNIQLHDGSAYFLYKENDYLSSERKVVKLYSINL